MKIFSALIAVLFLFHSFSQLKLEGKWKLESVVFKGDKLFNRAAGPINSSESRISVTYQTADENFNQQMNRNPYWFFSNSELNFINDSVFYRIATSITNGVHKNEVNFGSFLMDTDTKQLHLDLSGQKVVRQSYEISQTDSLMTLVRNDLIAVYKKSAVRINGEFSEPWNDLNVPIIIDAYHMNDIEWDLLAQDRRIHGVIHKAGEGLRADPKYWVRKSAVKKRKLLWGSYFLGTDDDPIEQADFYFNFTKNDSTELHCLDLEDVKAKGRMNLKQAIKFIERWYELSGKYPVLYCNNDVLQQINDKYGANSIFSNCPLWYARFRKDIPDWQESTWNTYTFWQFSSEINCEKKGECLYNPPGVNFDMDVNAFNGSVYELRILWPNF
jgi:GH25 family lysozyme M1 (1,4-beta-N-acetylmuramidase)